MSSKSVPWAGLMRGREGWARAGKMCGPGGNCQTSQQYHNRGEMA